MKSIFSLVYNFFDFSILISTLLVDLYSILILGYICQNEIIDIKEVTFVDQVRCYNSSEEVCSMTQKTVFQAQTEKKCDTHFVKECWIDYKEIAKAETVRICTKKPERICDLPDNHSYKIANECRTHYETGEII